jgi:16S rRNA (cytosine967-C5)-methyltransferase
VAGPRPRGASTGAAHAGRAGDRSRRVAFDALRRVTGEDAYANLVLPGMLAERGIVGRDAGFATELLNGTCRWLGTYDAVLEAASGRALTTLQPAVVDLLRLGAHQLLGMRVGTHAAVSETVDLAAATVGRRVTGLVNAVLRKVAAHDRDTWVERLGADRDPFDRLALAHAHPRWVVDAYAALLPPDELVDALAADNVSPEVSLVVRPGLVDVAGLAAQAGADGPGRWSPFAVRGHGNPADLALVREGRAGVQDEGSQLVAWGATRPPAAPGWWLDLSAGPGGKAALLTGLAAADGSRVVAGELAPHRAALVAAATRAYPPGQRPVVVVADATRPSWRAGSFTRVLADVPCTGLGALRRRPEARWRRNPADVEALHPLQRALLTTALDAAAPGGLVAYVTCSPHRRETADVVRETLAGRDDVDVVPFAEVLPELVDPALGAAAAPDGDFLQLWPHRHGTDAMFAAYLRRR